jgi:hypothetical protein
MRRTMRGCRRFSSHSHEPRDTDMSKRRCRHFDPREAGAVVSLRSDRGVATSGGVVDSWTSTAGSVVANGSGTARPAFSASSSSFGGFPAFTFDGVDDLLDMTATAGAVTQNKANAHGFAVVLDNNPSGGTAAHPVILLGTGLGVTRFRIDTRFGSVSGVHSIGRRLDVDSASISSPVTLGSDARIVESKADWASGVHAPINNGISGATAAYSSGSGSTSNTASAISFLGSDNSISFSPSTLTQITVFNTAIPPALAARVRHCAARAFHTPCS